MSLYSDVIDASVPRETLDDVVEWFQKEYGSRWKGKIADRLGPIAGVSHDSIMRRFQKGRTGKARTKEQTVREYKELGEEIPPKPPENGFHIYGVVYVKFSEGECEERDVDEYIRNSDQAESLVNMASAEIAQAVVNHYMTDGDIDDDEPIGIIGDCNPPRLHVEAIA